MRQGTNVPTARFDGLTSLQDDGCDVVLSEFDQGQGSQQTCRSSSHYKHCFGGCGSIFGGVRAGRAIVVLCLHRPLRILLSILFLRLLSFKASRLVSE